MTLKDLCLTLVKAKTIRIINRNLQVIATYEDDDDFDYQVRASRMKEREIMWIALEDEYLEIKVKGE